MHSLKEIIHMNNGGLSISRGRGGGASAFKGVPLMECLQSEAANEIRKFTAMMKGLGIQDRYNRNYSDLISILSCVRPECMGKEEKRQVESALRELVREFPDGARLYASAKKENAGFCAEPQTVKTSVRPEIDGLLARLC